MKAITHLGKRSPRDIKELQSFPIMFSRNTFHNIGRDGVSGSAKLAAQFVSLVWRKRFLCKAM
jgi:hypothetical protein